MAGILSLSPPSQPQGVLGVVRPVGLSQTPGSTLQFLSLGRGEWARG